MKKISLKKLNLKEVEKLSREQLKNVLGGWTGETEETDYHGTEENQSCNCGPNGDCIVYGLPGKTCTEICQGFENGC